MSSTVQAFVFTDFRTGVLGYNVGRLRKLFAEKGIVAHIFSDKGQRMFLDGGDTCADVEEISEIVRSRAAEADVNITIGASGGGYMALRQAAENAFAHAVLFSPFTTFDAAASILDPRGKRIVPNLHALEPDDRKRDGARILKEHDYQGSVHVFYPVHSRGDIFHTRNLALFDRLVLHPQDSKMHMFHADTGVTLPICLDTFAQQENLLGLMDKPTLVSVKAS